ncbi:M4 family metallopeptidase [Sphingomonas aerolata]|uniref:M4 family metallopeptidase n=1 Tax=Sphingomonas aerolata TaxID=185951 RepID=UPI0035A68355
MTAPDDAFGITPGAAPAPARRDVGNDEAASRAILQTFLEDAGNEAMMDATSPNRAEQVPDMRLRAAAATPDLSASTMSYQQTAASVPIFGGRIVVDLDANDKSFIALNGQVASQPTGDPVARLSPYEAANRLAQWAGVDLIRIPLVAAPQLNWYCDEPKDRWHLVYRFSNVPVSPPADDETTDPDPFPNVGRCCINAIGVPDDAMFDYLIDAHDGQIVYYFAVRALLDIPVPMRGIDASGNQRDFFGLGNGAGFVLVDPLRNIETFDFTSGNLAANPPPPFPTAPINSPAADLQNSAPAAVSAHSNAKIVFDFFNDVLKRNGIDDKGMKLVSVVNVDNRPGNPAPPARWKNAVWWQGKMWYGQDALPNSPNLVSLAIFLDVIGHELTHGVTETTSALVYRDLPGALNESFSDIFGVMIANWYPAGPQPVSSWKWLIGAGLGSNGGPIRDFSNPAATGQPGHMSQYVPLPQSRDHGGVHIYSGIHNKAVHNLLTATDPASGQLSFPTAEAALLLYLTLTRLTPTSDFSAARRTFENVVSAYHAANATLRQQRLAAIAAAYAAVGIV